MEVPLQPDGPARMPPQGVVSLRLAWASAAASRKADPLDRYHLADVLRRPGVIQHHTMTCKSPPGLFQPQQAQDKEGVVHHAAWRLMTRDREFQQRALPRHQAQRRVDRLLAAGKFVMRQPGREHCTGFLPQILHTPGDKPLTPDGCSTGRGRLDPDPGSMVVALLLQCVAPTLMPCMCKIAQSASQQEAPWRTLRLTRRNIAYCKGIRPLVPRDPFPGSFPGVLP